MILKLRKTMESGTSPSLRSTRSAAVLLLIVAILVNQPRVTVAVSAVGLIAGVFVLRRGDVRRVAMVAMAGLAAALVMGVSGLLQ